MTPREKADRAKQLLEDELLKDAFSVVKHKLVEQLESADSGDVDVQHDIALMLKLLRRVRTQLEMYLHDQQMIEAQQRQSTWMDRARQTIRF